MSAVLADVLYAGVNHSIPGNGGPECVNYISNGQKLLESLFICPICIYLMIWAFRRVRLPPIGAPNYESSHSVRRVVAGLLCLVFGAEIGYKMASQTLIYLLNPCHVATIAQIWLLLDEPTGWLTCLTFRIHFASLAGATLALAFPVLNTRLMPYEVATYYTQHCLILIVPFYLVTLGGAYSLEGIWDRYFLTFTMSLMLLYHFIPLQIFGLLTQVNLNNVICPAVSDPFHCKYWRLITLVHQSAYLPLHTRIYALLCVAVASIWKRPQNRQVVNGSVNLQLCQNGVVQHTEDHEKES